MSLIIVLAFILFLAWLSFIALSFWLISGEDPNPPKCRYGHDGFMVIREPDGQLDLICRNCGQDLGSVS